MDQFSKSECIQKISLGDGGGGGGGGGGGDMVSQSK